MEIIVCEFLKEQLVWIRRRASGAEKARINWWIERVTALAKQEPKAVEIETPSAPVAQAEHAIAEGVK